MLLSFTFAILGKSKISSSAEIVCVVCVCVFFFFCFFFLQVIWDFYSQSGMSDILVFPMYVL